MNKVDMGYKNLAPMTFSFDESQDIASEVWDAYGATAFCAPSGNMILELVNLAAAKAISAIRDSQREKLINPKSILPDERECCGTFPRTPHRATCKNFRGKKGGAA